jgi:hypothetical protein
VEHDPNPLPEFDDDTRATFPRAFAGCAALAADPRDCSLASGFVVDTLNWSTI